MENRNTSMATQEKQVAITEKVRKQIVDLETKKQIVLPKNYSVENALKSAYLILKETLDKDKRPVLQSCSEASITNTLFNMAIQGLSPAKKQCYFIAYGGQLQLSRSYLGTIAVTKRLSGIVDVKAHVIYEGDKFEIEYDSASATIWVKEYKPSFSNVDIKKIVGAFAVILGESGPIHTEVMTMAQIRAAWNQGQAKGNSGAHLNFSEEMAKKSVINRACKSFWNTSDDSDLLIGAINDTPDKDDVESDTRTVVESTTYEVQEEMAVEEKVIIDVESKPTANEPAKVTRRTTKQQTVEDPIDPNDEIFEGAPF
jgi:recombination protein RecT